MKRLYKRYRKLLNRFFVAVVVSVCLINTVSLDAQAAASFTSVVADVSITLIDSSGTASSVDYRAWRNSNYITVPVGTREVILSVRVSPSTPIPSHSFAVADISLYMTNTGYAQIIDLGCSVDGFIPVWSKGGDPYRQHFFDINGTITTSESVQGAFFLTILLSFPSLKNSETIYFTSFSGGIEYWSDESTSIGPTIKDNTDKLVQGQNETNNKLDNITNGYDSSSGNTASGKLDGSVSDFEQAEGSIFDSAQGHLKDFEFFDFNSIPAVVTGLSFVTSSMTAVFDAMGGLSGAGIVLSVLFAVMFLSIVIGLYRYFK